MMAPLSLEALMAGELREGADCDFKSRLDLDEPRAKSSLIDDVTAFLNKGEGRILVGVEERGGVFAAFRPLTGDADKIGLRILSILQDSIDPAPIGVEVRTVDIDGGFLLDLVIPEHRLRPYQNKLTGGFQIRTGAKNRVLSREAIRSLFTARETYESDLAALIETEEQRLARRDLMVTDGPSLLVSILPSEFYERGRPPFDQGRGVIKAAPVYHYGRPEIFRGCEGGVEATTVTLNGRMLERLFISDCWFVHAHIVHPLKLDHERLQLPEARENLLAYLQSLGPWLKDQGLRGPFCTRLAIRSLHRGRLMDRLFPATQNIVLPHSLFGERLPSEADVDALMAQVRRATIWG